MFLGVARAPSAGAGSLIPQRLPGVVDGASAEDAGLAAHDAAVPNEFLRQ